MTTKRKLILLVTLIFLWAVIVWKSGLTSYLNLNVIAQNHLWLQNQLANNFGTTLAVTSIFYFFFVAMGLPGLFILAVSCGYLFGTTIGSAILIFVGGLGSFVPYTLSRFLIADWIGQKFNTWIPRIKEELDKSPILYMLAMRLNPAIPFIVQNTVPGFLGISPKVYMPTTFIGLTPPSIAVAMFGSGLNEIFTEQDGLSIGTVMSSEIVTSLFLISLFILIPLILRSIKSRFKHEK
ncbi:MAG: TVP38/TMEM64 family protein [Gammaproteobacteria bacterium]